jgi:hypothetical protein
VAVRGGGRELSPGQRERRVAVRGAESETSEGWPLLIVEAEANGGSRSTLERGPSFVSLTSSFCRYKRFLSCLSCSRGPSTKNLFPHCTIFNFFYLHRPES